VSQIEPQDKMKEPHSATVGHVFWGKLPFRSATEEVLKIFLSHTMQPVSQFDGRELMDEVEKELIFWEQ